ncbi:MAG: efflux RND transporter periplasmic adaptor subunit, partial [Flavobacteriaceae bacterium]|nr:efflux RND transporter periplasmic adaptor subunit [Flavobacteriaceae bacterium]
GALYWLKVKNEEDPVVYKSEKPAIRNVIRQTVATGNIIPKEEILIKPNISGIIDEILVEAGTYVNAGELIAKVRVIPNVTNLNNAKNAIDNAKIALDNSKKIFARQEALFEKGVISANDYDNAKLSYDQAQQSYKNAVSNFEIVKTGNTAGIGAAANTQIYATVSGMVLDVPVKVGNQVIEANNFNEGTTIAVIADVNKMNFEGTIDESEVGKVKEGMPLEITVGALQNKKFNATLNYIAPKGVDVNGAIQFDIKGTLDKKDLEDTFIRAGLSANASVILEQADSVLTIPESLLQFEPKTQKPFVEVETGDQKFDKRYVETGVSDGIFVEIKEGISENDAVKVWNPVKVVENRTRGRRGAF